jgi:hypothetical protein
MTLAWAVARKRPQHRSVAALLTFGLAADVVRQVLQWVVLVPAYAALAGAPATGWVRVAGHVEQALFLAYPAALAGTMLWIYIARRPWPVAIGYVITALALVASYPALRGEPLGKIYLGFQLACVAVMVGAFVHWVLFRKNPPTPSHFVVALMSVVEIANVTVGPWRVGLFDRWNLAQLGYCMLYAALILVQWGWSWIISNSSR